MLSYRGLAGHIGSLTYPYRLCVSNVVLSHIPNYFTFTLHYFFLYFTKCFILHELFYITFSLQQIVQIMSLTCVGPMRIVCTEYRTCI